MSDLIDLVAKAMCANEGGVEGTWDAEYQEVRDHYRELSRVALTALRTHYISQQEDGFGDFYHAIAEITWELKEGKNNEVV